MGARSEWICWRNTDAGKTYQKYIRNMERRVADGESCAEQVLQQIAYLVDAWDMTWDMLQTAREQGNLE